MTVIDLQTGPLPAPQHVGQVLAAVAEDCDANHVPVLLHAVEFNGEVFWLCPSEGWPPDPHDPTALTVDEMDLLGWGWPR